MLFRSHLAGLQDHAVRRGTAAHVASQPLTSAATVASSARVCAWGWIVWRSRTTGLKIRSSVLAAMCAATVLTATAALWPVMEPAVFHALGIAKKPKPPAS